MPVESNGTNGHRPPIRFLDDRGKPVPMTDEQRREWIEQGLRALDSLDDIVDESDADDERWDEALRNLGVDPATGRGLPR